MNATDGSRSLVWPHSPSNDGRPLEGVKVLDVSRVLAGPYCTMILGDLGADVVKVEPPYGDETRRWGPPFRHETATYYFGANRNKWGIVLDLQSESGRSALANLVEQADILVQNYTGDTATRLGVDYATTSTLNPTLVHLSLSGFGPAEPDRRGYDLVAQALSGLMEITGPNDGSPARVGVPISDLSTGLFGAIGVLAALRRREHDGKGAQLEVSLFDASVALLANQSMSWLLAGEETPRLGSEHPNLAPYGAFATLDGHIVIAVGNDGQFEALCRVLGPPALAGDPRFATNRLRIQHRAELRSELEARLGRRDRDTWRALLDAAAVPNAAVRPVSSALTSDEARSVSDVVHPTLGAIPQVGNPIQIFGQYLWPYLAPPMLGEHTDQVLGSIGEVVHVGTP